MSGNTFGKVFSLTTFGESHGSAIGGIIEGCPAGITVDLSKVKLWMDRRKPGQSPITTQRKEDDEVEFLSGIFEGITLGTPIGFMIRNRDQISADYAHLQKTYRPSHADYTWEAKYGIRDYRGGGRSSARETACRVVAGAVALQLLENWNITINSWVSSVGSISMPSETEADYSQIYENDVRCPHKPSALKMVELINQVRDEGDTIGGIVTCKISGVMAGLGEPVFDKINADLAKAMMSINAVKAFEIGSGFSAASMKGSEHNDPFASQDGKIRTLTNHSGGIQGGITNGEDIYFKVAFKPVATIQKEQVTVNTSGETETITGKGRHDPCVVPRAVPVVQSMAALVITDHFLRNRTSKF